MIQDTINSIRLTLSERIGNPLISATIISFVVFNWKLSLLLFADVTYDAKIQKILDLYPDSTARFDGLFLYPICFGLLWTIFWPVISMIINTYWYWMKSHISNLKLRVERKKKLSEAEAAELYSTIDAQESRYLDFLKERQNKVDSLTRHIADVVKEHQDLQLEIGDERKEKEGLQSKLSGLQRQFSKSQDDSNRVKQENDSCKHSLDEILNRALEFAEHLPGLKSMTYAISKADNHRADESWLWEEFHRQESSFLSEDSATRQQMFNFYLAIGLLKRDSNSHIVFGERYRYIKDRIIGKNNNSPEIHSL